MVLTVGGIKRCCDLSVRLSVCLSVPRQQLNTCHLAAVLYVRLCLPSTRGVWAADLQHLHDMPPSCCHRRGHFGSTLHPGHSLFRRSTPRPVEDSLPCPSIRSSVCPVLRILELTRQGTAPVCLPHSGMRRIFNSTRQWPAPTRPADTLRPEVRRPSQSCS